MLVLKYTCLPIVCDICEAGGEDFIDCWYSNILACLLYVTYVRRGGGGGGHVHVCMCEEMFVSRMNYNISLFLFFIY